MATRLRLVRAIAICSCIRKVFFSLFFSVVLFYFPLSFIITLFSFGVRLFFRVESCLFSLLSLIYNLLRGVVPKEV